MLLCLSSAPRAQKSSASSPDEYPGQALFGTTWTATAFGERFDYYFLDRNVLVYRTRNGIFVNDGWNFRDNTVAIGILRNPAYPLQLSFIGVLKEGRIVGKASNLVRQPDGKSESINSEWIAERLINPIPELITAAPPVRPRPTAPVANIADFDGTYSAVVPELESGKTSMVKYVLRCAMGSGCILSIGDSGQPQAYTNIRSLRGEEHSQAKFALGYSKDRKEVASRDAPWLRELLYSNSELAACLDLRGTREPVEVWGTTILCKLDRNPWKKPVVIFMGTILANCGPSACRYGLLPLFRE